MSLRPARPAAARWAGALLATLVLLAGCGGEDPQYRDFGNPNVQPKVEGSSGFNVNLFGLGRSSGGAGIGVNSYLWRASLDTISFMPLVSADPFGGVIISDWYTTPESPSERFKLVVYILDTKLTADGVKVNVFRQQLVGNQEWKDAAVSAATGPNVENAILTRARQLRIKALRGE